MEAAALVQPVTEHAIPAPPRYGFTKENARAYAARGHAAQRAKRALLSTLKLAPKPPAEPPAAPTNGDFADIRRDRVRAQLNKLDALIFAEMERKHPDTKKIKELADAARHVGEQERQLSGRPLPGTRRPDSEAPPASRGSRLFDDVQAAPTSPTRDAQE